MSKNLIVALMGLASVAAMSTAAFAHPKLMSSTPAENATVAAGPSELRLTFNEKLEPSMSGVEVKDQSGKKIETGKAATDPADAKLLVIPLSAPLGDGTYNVDWHAVAADTHRIKGSYTFTVAMLASPPRADKPAITGVADGVSVNTWYKQTVYDRAKNSVGKVEDVLISGDGKANAFVIGVGGFLGIGEKDVKVPFGDVKQTMQDGKPHLTIDTSKDAMKAAPGYKYDRKTMTWVSETK